MDKFLLGISLFNDADYFSAHDAFEDEWRGCNNNDKLFFQGLTQIAVGSFHFASGNYKGSLSQFKKGVTKLRQYLPDYKNVDLSLLIENITEIIDILESNFDKKVNMNQIDIPKILMVKTN